LTHKANKKLLKADVNHEKLLSHGFLIEQLQNWTEQDRNTRRHPYHQFIVFQRLKKRAEIEEEETNKIEFSRFCKIMLQKIIHSGKEMLN
jgi:hypothetical protein